MPQRYGHMKGVKTHELINRIYVKRIYTPEHNNSFFRQLVSYLFFALAALRIAIIKRNSYDIIFASSSRLGTGFLGFIASRITGKSLYIDIRDIFSDNLRSIPFFKGSFGNFFIKIFRIIEKNIVAHAKWVNFVSPGFFSYPHLKNGLASLLKLN